VESLIDIFVFFLIIFLGTLATYYFCLLLNYIDKETEYWNSK